VQYVFSTDQRESVQITQCLTFIHVLRYGVGTHYSK